MQNRTLNLALSCYCPQCPKIATALCAITCCITLLCCACMPSFHYAASAVLHVPWLYLPFRNKQRMQLAGKLPFARRMVENVLSRTCVLPYVELIFSTKPFSLRNISLLTNFWSSFWNRELFLGCLLMRTATSLLHISEIKNLLNSSLIMLLLLITDNIPLREDNHLMLFLEHA